MTIDKAWSWLVKALMHRRTHALEVFLGLEAIVAGAWVLWPGQNAFTQATALSLIPDYFLGAVLVLHGIGTLMALHWGDVHMCRRAALSSTGIWTFIAVVLAWTPPVTLFVVPLVAMLALASVWVYVRLYLRYPPPQALFGSGLRIRGGLA